jgi:hypothetical protein
MGSEGDAIKPVSPSRSLVISLGKRHIDIDMEQVKASPLFDIEYGVNIW